MALLTEVRRKARIILPHITRGVSERIRSAIPDTIKRAVPLARVLNGTLNGSFIGNGRILWVHNPFGSDYEKAKDPFINLTTLSRLSRSSDEAVRTEATRNLAFRFAESATSKDLRFILSTFDKAVTIKALLMTPHEEWLDYGSVKDVVFRSAMDNPSNSDLRQLLIKMITFGINSLAAYSVLCNSATQEEMHQIATGPRTPRPLKRLMAKDTRMGTDALVWFVNSPLAPGRGPGGVYAYADDGLNCDAYNTLRPRLDPDVLGKLTFSPSRRVLQMVIEDRRSPAGAVESAKKNLRLTLPLDTGD